MTKKKDALPPAKEIRKNIRLSQEDMEAAERVAMKLHSEGVPGLLDENGDIVFTAVLRRLIHDVDRGQLSLIKKA